jgi:tetratricopeptide (TPR) repeat protein
LAYEGIVNILSRMGIIADQIRYSYTLAELYFNKGDYEKAKVLYERILELEPNNKVAEGFLLRIKDILKEGSERLTVSDYKGDEVGAMIHTDAPREGGVEEAGKDEELTALKGRSDIGFFTATIEETFDEEETVDVPAFEKQRRKTYMYSAGVAALIIIAVGVSVILMRGKQQLSIEDKPAVSIEDKWINNNIELRTNNYDINITKIKGDLITESGLSGTLKPVVIDENQFYLVSFKPIKGCLPAKFVAKPYDMISLIDRNGLSKEIRKMDELNGLNRVLYRSNLCRRDFAAVFMKLFVYHNKNINAAALSINGLEGSYPVIVRWES